MHSTNVESRTMSKVLWRLIPFLIVLYVFNYLDRINVSIAKLTMSSDLGMDEAVFGRGFAIFFIGYFLFEVPSNAMLERFGARIWIARIMISWGVVSTAFVFTQGKWSFYGLRLLLGVAEAGFFPGIVLYLTYWVPARRRAHFGAIFMTSIAIAGMIGNPLSSAIIEGLKDAAQLKGWQWVFLLEGIPTIFLGISVFLFLRDKPAKASWLTQEERDWLTSTIEKEQEHTRGGHARHGFFDGMKNWRVWMLSAVYMSIMFGFYGINFWTPTIINDTMTREFAGVLNENAIRNYAGWLSALPFVAAIVGMVGISIVADRTGKRREVLICSATTGVIGLILASYTQTTVLTVAALSLAAVGIFGSLSPFWTLPSSFLAGSAAAAGIAFINSWGNLGGGYLGNEVMGQLKKYYTGRVERPYMYGLLIDAAVLALGVGLMLAVRVKKESAASEFKPTLDSKPDIAH